MCVCVHRYVSSHCLLRHRSGRCSVLFFSYTNKLSVQTMLLSFPMCGARLGLLNKRQSGNAVCLFRGKKGAGECAESAGH